MRSILEKALLALLNEEKATADALFHDFILERSRQIHESLRQGEDFILDESMENELAIDEMFSEDDLSDDMGDGEQIDEFATDDEESQAPAFGTDDAVAGDEFGAEGEEGLEGEGEPETIEDRVTGLEAELQSLAAEFDAMMNGDEEGDTDEFGAEGEEETVEEGTVEIVAHNDGEIDITATTDDDELGGDTSMGMGMDAGFGGDDLGSDLGDDELNMDDFDDLSESAVDDLEKVTVATGDGREQGNGKFKQNTQSIIKSHPVGDRAFKGTPVKINAKEHSGYAAEPSPSSKKLATSAKNVKSKGEEGQAGVKKEGDTAALLNKNSGEDKGAQSLIGSKKL
jgi:hypothetical protein